MNILGIKRTRGPSPLNNDRIVQRSVVTEMFKNVGKRTRVISPMKEFENK